MYYYKKHIGDYRAATGHLTLLEHGVYTCLMDSYYLNEQALPKDERQLFRLAGARTDEEKQAVLDIVNEFFIPTETHWVHDRIDFELKKYHAKAETNRKNGKIGGRPSKESKENPDGLVSQSKSDEKDENQNPEETLTHKPINPLTHKPNIEDIPVKTEKKSKPVLTMISPNFGISERVKNWASEKGYSNLELHLERFIELATMKNYKYADWDLAFMKAVREDWGKINKPVYQSGYQNNQQLVNNTFNRLGELADAWDQQNADYTPY